MDGALETVLMTVLATASLALFWRFTRREPEVAAGVSTLRHGPALGVLGLAFPVVL